MDYDLKIKVNEFFKALRKAGYFARQNFEDCQSCGIALIPEGTVKYVFYHSQDKQHAIDSGRLMLAWGGDGKEIVAMAQEAGLKTIWDGTENQRIQVTI